MVLRSSENAVIISLYRSLSRMGRKFDKKPLIRALIAHPLPFSFQVLLGGIDRDFYGNNMSVQTAIKNAFRHKIIYKDKLKTIDDFHGVQERLIAKKENNQNFANEEERRQKMAEEENELQLRIDLALKSNATLSCLLNLIHETDYHQLPSTSSLYSFEESSKMNTSSSLSSSLSKSNKFTNNYHEKLQESQSENRINKRINNANRYSFYDEKRKDSVALDKALLLLEEAKHILNEENKIRMQINQENEKYDNKSKNGGYETTRLKSQESLHSEIKDLYQSSVSLKPTAEGLTNLGWIHHLNGDISEAKLYAMKSIELDSTYGNAFNDYGLYLQKEGNLNEALNYFKKAVMKPRQRGFDKHDSAYINMGHLYLEIGDPLKALHSYLMALYYIPCFQPGKACTVLDSFEVRKNQRKYEEIRGLIVDMASFLCKV